MICDDLCDDLLRYVSCLEPERGPQRETENQQTREPAKQRTNIPTSQQIDSHSIDDIQSVHFQRNILKLQRDLQLLYQALPSELQQPILMNRGRTSLMLGVSEDGELDKDAMGALSPHLEAIMREASQHPGSVAREGPSPPASPMARRNSS